MHNKMMKSLKRRFVTLIEMMIVMFLIALITGVVAYNYRGTLDEGKAFKTKVGIEKLETILNLAVSDNPNLNLTGEGWKEYIRHSPLVQNASALERDGWGQAYDVSIDNNTNAIHVTSQKFDDYKKNHQGSLFRD